MNSNQARNWQQHYSQPQQDQKKKIVVRVRKKSWLTKGEKIIYAFLCTLIIGFGIFIISYSSSTDTLNRDVQTLEGEIELQLADNANLLYEVRELSKPERITKIAKENGLKIQDTKVKRASN